MWKKRKRKEDESVNFTLQVYIPNYVFRSAQFELTTEAQLTTDQWTAQLIPHYASSWQNSGRMYKPDRPDCSHCKLLGKLLDGGVTRRWCASACPRLLMIEKWRPAWIHGKCQQQTETQVSQRCFRHSFSQQTPSVPAVDFNSVVFMRPAVEALRHKLENPCPKPVSAATVLFVGQNGGSVFTTTRWIVDLQLLFEMSFHHEKS